MKEIKRYKIASDKGNSSNVTQCDSGHWVHYSEIEQLQERIKELESEKHINEIKAQGIEQAISHAIVTYQGDYTPSNTIRSYKKALKEYIKKLRTNYE